MNIQSYPNLKVWQKAMDLVVDCYNMTREFPKFEIYGLASQLQRAAMSVPANIAEGRSLPYTKEFIRHLSIAYGSLAELETHILISERLRYLSREQPTMLLDQAAEVARMINGLRKSLKQRDTHPF